MCRLAEECSNNRAEQLMCRLAEECSNNRAEQLMCRLAEECSNNRAEQLAMLKLWRNYRISDIYRKGNGLQLYTRTAKLLWMQQRIVRITRT
jgi:hypothetical protein